MKFIHQDLGYIKEGDIVEVALRGNGANIRIMDDMNYESYTNGNEHRYLGGIARVSPMRIPIPFSGNWHMAVDLQSLSGQVSAIARVVESD